MLVCNFARVGKALLRGMVGVQKNYKEIEYKKEFDESVCKGCKFYVGGCKNSDLVKTYCNEYCNKAYKYVEITKYINEANEFKIGVKERLSKIQVKQMILYHFLGVDKNGIVKNIDEKSVANYLGCDIKTVRNNNERLIELNYIIFSRIDRFTINVILVDYKSYHLPSSRGGRGYITMSKELLDELLIIDNVNTLRLEIRNLIKFDDMNIDNINITSSKYTYKQISRFLPSYINYISLIKDLLKDSSDLFHVDIQDDGIEFKLKDKYNSKITKDNLKNQIYSNIFDFCIDNGFLFSDKELEDLLQMGMQYSCQAVIGAVEYIDKNYYLRGKDVNNVCGLVRTIIVNKVREAL